MSSPNHYAPPRSDIALPAQELASDTQRLNRIASGQRLVIFGLIGTMVAAGLQATLGLATTVFSLGALVASIAGVVRATGALGKSLPTRVIYAILMFVPLLNWLVMASVSTQATKVLKAAGFKVGLFGAGQRAA